MEGLWWAGEGPISMGKRGVWRLMGICGQGIPVFQTPWGPRRLLCPSVGLAWSEGPPFVVSACWLRPAAGRFPDALEKSQVSPRSVFPWPGRREDTHGRERGPAGTVLPAKVISCPHLRPARLLASARTLMDKTSPPVPTFPLHPVTGQPWRSGSGHPEGGRQCPSAPRVPEFPQGRVVMEGFLEEEWGWKQFCGCLARESGHSGSTQTPHKGSDDHLGHSVSLASRLESGTR